jgi:hypothetical protein
MGVGASGLDVGDVVGLEDGAEVGCKGDFVGPRDGFLEGITVGKALGRKEVVVILGVDDGLPVGSIGNSVGLSEGAYVGLVVASNVGLLDGAVNGIPDGCDDGKDIVCFEGLWVGTAA